MTSATTTSAAVATGLATEERTSALGKGARLTVFYLLLLIIALIFILPYLMSVFAAFKPLPAILAESPLRPPTSPTWSNFSTLFSQYDFGRYLANTLIVTVILTAGQVIFSMMGAYAFARMSFPGRDSLFWLYLMTLMVPNIVTLVPLYVLFAHSHLLNTYWAIFLPYVLGVPYSVFLMRQYFMTIPKEVMEAARLDGCSESRILWKIIVPISRPILITATLLAFVFGWNNFMWPLIVTNSNSLNVLTVGIANFNSNFGVEWNLILAFITLTNLPTNLLFLLAQRHIVAVLTAGAVKG